MVGATCAMAAGMHERFGWKLVAMSALASITVDCDGMTLLISKEAFAEGHRVWSHNLLAVVLSGLLVGVADYRLDLVSRMARVFAKLSRIHLAPETLELRSRFSQKEQTIWITCAIVAGLIHLPSDLVVSGSASLPDWNLKLLWPFSNQGWVYPMVQWGDAGITLIFVAGMFAMVRWPGRLTRIAQATTAGVVAYIMIRGTNY